MTTRGLAVLVAAVTMLAAASHAQAQGFDMRDIMGGGPGFGGGYSRGGSSIPRSTVMLPGQLRARHHPHQYRRAAALSDASNGQALSYGIGVGRDGFRWSGVHRITAKKEWPDWTPPAQMLRRRPDLPRHMPGGVENPLGARAMYLGSTLYRIHGSNEPETIGQAVSSGCFRMTNEDVVDLYNRVSVGTTVIVKN